MKRSHPTTAMLLLFPLVLLAGCGKNSDTSADGAKTDAPSAVTQAATPPIPDNVPPETKARIAREMEEAQARARASVETQQKQLPPK